VQRLLSSETLVRAVSTGIQENEKGKNFRVVGGRLREEGGGIAVWKLIREEGKLIKKRVSQFDAGVTAEGNCLRPKSKKKKGEGAQPTNQQTHNTTC